VATDIRMELFIEVVASGASLAGLFLARFFSSGGIVFRGSCNYPLQYGSTTFVLWLGL